MKLQGFSRFFVASVFTKATSRKNPECNRGGNQVEQLGEDEFHFESSIRPSLDEDLDKCKQNSIRCGEDGKYQICRFNAWEWAECGCPGTTCQRRDPVNVCE